MAKRRATTEKEKIVFFLQTQECVKINTVGKNSLFLEKPARNCANSLIYVQNYVLFFLQNFKDDKICHNYKSYSL